MIDTEMKVYAYDVVCSDAGTLEDGASTDNRPAGESYVNSAVFDR